MQTGDSNIVQGLNRVSEYVERDDGFFGNGNIGSPSRNNQDCAFSTYRFVPSNNNRPGSGIEHGFRHDFLNAGILLAGRSRHENVVLVLRHGFDNSSHLFGRFAGAENSFRKSLAQAPMVIDIGKSQVFKRKVPEPIHCPVIRQNPGLVIAENLTNLVLGHGRPTLYLNCWSPRPECSIIGAHMWIWDKLKITLEMIKFEHTIFALPFALIGALLASHGLPSAWQIVWILVAMVGARSAAMAFNRIVDVRFDRLNPRTASRALPAGTLSLQFAVAFTVAMSALFIFAAWQLNTLCFYLSFPLLGILLLYSYTKRFTAWSHLFLGASIGMAPLAAWLAIQGRFAWPPVLLSLAVMFWVAGFDVIYSLQDAEFDRSASLFSLPSRLGIAPALHISTAFHVATVALLVATALMTSLGNVAFAGIAVVAAILFWEHRIVKPNDLSRVNLAFFSLNGYVSLLLLLTFATDIFLR